MPYKQRYQMNTNSIDKEKTYTLFELADLAGIRVSDLQNLVQGGKFKSHITDETEVINGSDFLEWATYDNPRHFQ